MSSPGNESTIQLSETDARDTILQMMKTGHWTAHQTPDGKKLILRHRSSAVRTPSDTIPPKLHVVRYESQVSAKNNDT